jgi:hypothetical protein
MHVHSIKWQRYGLLQATEIYSSIFSKASIWSLGPTQPPILWVLDELSPGLERLGREPDDSPLPSTRLWKNGAKI